MGFDYNDAVNKSRGMYLLCFNRSCMASALISRTYGSTKAPFTQGFDLRAIFEERPEKNIRAFAQNQNFLFMCNCWNTTLVPSSNHQSCCSGTSRTNGAEWRHNYCHGGSRVDVVAECKHIGVHSCCSMDATAWLKETQSCYNGGRSIAQMDKQCLQEYAFFYGATNGRPVCIHSATTAMCAFPLPSLSDLRSTDRLGDLYAAVLKMLKSSRRPWRPWRRGLNVLCATVEEPRHNFRSPLCLKLRPGQFCGHTRETQRSQPLC